MKLTYENYHSIESNQEYMSNSQFKSFVIPLGGCEAQAMAKLKGEWEDDDKEALLAGRYFHSWNEGRLDKFITDNKDKLLTGKGNKYAFISKVDEVIEFVKQDDKFMEAISGTKEVIMTFDLFGLKWKMMLDSHYPKDKYPRFCDLKLLAEINPDSLKSKKWDKHAQCYRHVIDAYGYLTQMGLYAFGEAQNMKRKAGEYAEPFIAIATKEKYPDKAIISFSSQLMSVTDFVNQQINLVGNFIDRVKEVKEGREKPIRCESCDYCRATKKLTGTIHYTQFTNIYGESA
jgi:hypothetical protein